MNPPIRVEPEAEQDLAEAYRWYEDRETGLGAEFLRAVDACLAMVQRYPLAYRVVYRRLRRAFVRRFPYLVFYLIEGDAIVVMAVCHARRDPRVWQSRSR